MHVLKWFYHMVFYGDVNDVHDRHPIQIHDIKVEGDILAYIYDFRWYLNSIISNWRGGLPSGLSF